MEHLNANKPELEKKIEKEMQSLYSNHDEQTLAKPRLGFIDKLVYVINILGSTSGSIFCYYDFMIARRKKKSAELDAPYKSEPIDKDYS
jgi:hypothetical protein